MNMKNILALILFFVALPAFAQQQGEPLSLGQAAQPILGRTNESRADLASADADANYIGTDSKGSVYTIPTDSAGNAQAIVPVSNSAGLNGAFSSVNGYFTVGTDTIEALSTTTVLVLTAHVARVGDIIQPTGGTAGNIDVEIPICSVATNSVTLCYPLPATPSTDAITIKRPKPLFTPKEDSAHVSGDTGLLALGVVNTSLGSTGAAQADYSQFSTNGVGAIYADINFSAQSSAGGANALLKLEDVTASGGDAGVAVFGAGWSAVPQVASQTGDYTTLTLDLGGRLVTTTAPAGETWQSCGTATASTADVAIKAAVASNRSYVTSITCASSDADNATNINFKDATTVIAVGGVSQMAAGAAGTFTATFPTPLRTTANTAFNFNTAVSTSSVICCATGYISTI